MRQCMGGWCTMRDRCQHYSAPESHLPPAERLCEPGDEHEQIRRAHAIELAADPRVGVWVAGMETMQ